ncbi:zinc ribbon domain-containing protein [Cohnella nanjingensis]|uniref:Zinc ribbon domain-containing protein n=1 Tax=Cohnella nanjingensis TaxID=1387779 RepID=A0A7X0RTG1_9BACL|nr:zinc ribbon domain-containing protein [Cohnella nanjingensis]MBB6673398.1 zinc ribbon domain-containing protein [Cohnella nanjingensis]
MSFFKKFTETVSKGVTTATEKAQQTVEITKIHSQISGKRKEIEKRFSDIGEAVYEAYLQHDLSRAEGVIIPACEEIAGFRREITGLEDRIRALRNEKECSCGQKVPFDTRFCPACGSPFADPVPPEPVATADPLAPSESVADAAAEAADADPTAERVELEEAPESEADVVRLCAECGAELPEDARFCQTCGHPVYP